MVFRRSTEMPEYLFFGEFDMAGEHGARGTSRSGEWRLVALALLGPVILHGLCAGMLAGGVWLMWHAHLAQGGNSASFKVGLPLAILGLSGFWALFTVRPRQEWRRCLSRAEAPQLWAMVDDLSQALNAPRVTHLALNDGYNASALVSPSWWPWRAPRVEIVLGLPLMLALDAKQLRAVLAHEMGHISHDHSRAARLVWRAMAHGQAMGEVFGESLIGAILGWFHARYWPLLEKAGASFFRAQEFEADAAAAELCGADVMAQALLAITAREAVHARYMQELQEAVMRGEDVPDPLSRMRQLLADPAMMETMRAWLQRALAQEDDPLSTHPSLKERLRALGLTMGKVSPPEVGAISAFDVMCTDGGFAAAAREAATMGREQMPELSPAMTAQRSEVVARLGELEENILRHGPNAQDNISAARRFLWLGQPDKALKVLDELFARHDMAAVPALAQALRGAALLDLGQARGVYDLFEAAGRDPALMSMAAEQVGQWLDGPGVAHDSPQLRAEIARLEELHAEGARERERADGQVRLAPASLTEREWQGLKEALAGHGEALRQVWVAARQCEKLPKWRHVEILVEFRPSFWLWAFDGRVKMARVMEDVEEALPDFHGSTFALRAWPFFTSYWFVRRMRKLAEPMLTAGRGRGRPLRKAVPQILKGAGKPVTRRATAPLRGGMVVASLALPGVLAWHVLVDNSRTRHAQARFERAYAQQMGARYWRKTGAASPDSPEKTLRAYFAARRAHDASPFLPIYTRETTRMLRARRVTPLDMDTEVRAHAACGAARVIIEKDRAVLRHEVGKRQCLPYFLRREQGRWRVDLAAMSRHLTFDGEGQWRFRAGLGGSYAFGFKAWNVDRSGYPYAAQERS